MGRKSKLTERQWEAIGKRLLEGEKARALAREFGVSEATIRGRFSAQVAEIKTVANQIVATESALKALPISAQIAAHDLAAQLRSISGHLAGAATAHRLSGIAHAKVQEIDDAKPLDSESIESLKGVSILTEMANKASVIGLNLLSANKEMVKAGMQDAEVQPVTITVQVEDASLPEPNAQ
jgi:hypothetical protein